MSIDILFAKKEIPFLRTLLEAMLSSSIIYTTTYLDAVHVFNDACSQKSSTIVTGARKLCRSTITHLKLKNLSSKDAKPWFEFFRSLNQDIYEMECRLRQITQEKVQYEINVCRALIANDVIEKHWQTLGYKILIITAWKTYNFNSRLRRKNKFSLYLKGYYLNNKYVLWGMKQNNLKTIENIKGIEIINYQKNIPSNKEKIKETTKKKIDKKDKQDEKKEEEEKKENEKWLKTIILLKPRTVQLSNRSALLLKQCIHYWYEYSLLLSKLRFGQLLFKNLEVEKFLQWDCRRIKSFTLKLNGTRKK